MAAKKFTDEYLKRKAKYLAELVPKSKLVTPKFLDCSTGHVTERDMGLLAKDDCQLVTYQFEYGTWVHVLQDKPYGFTPKTLKALGFSDGFIKVYLAAREADCWFIKLDSDGETYEQFEHFDW